MSKVKELVSAYWQEVCGFKVVNADVEHVCRQVLAGAGYGNVTRECVFIERPIYAPNNQFESVEIVYRWLPETDEMIQLCLDRGWQITINERGASVGESASQEEDRRFALCAAIVAETRRVGSKSAGSGEVEQRTVR